MDRGCRCSGRTCFKNGNRLFQQHGTAAVCLYCGCRKLAALVSKQMNRLTEPAAIRELLSRHGFRFSKSMGQNFLIDASVPERIAESAGADRDCAVLEIGPGIGCLTAELAKRAGKVLSVELDRSLAPLLKETLGEFDNVEILYSDILKLDLRKRSVSRHLPDLRLPFTVSISTISRSG